MLRECGFPRELLLQMCFFENSNDSSRDATYNTISAEFTSKESETHTMNLSHALNHLGLFGKYGKDLFYS